MVKGRGCNSLIRVRRSLSYWKEKHQEIILPEQLRDRGEVKHKKVTKMDVLRAVVGGM